MSKITIDRSVVDQALEALDEADLLMEHRQNIELRRSALVALRAALEQPQVEQPTMTNIAQRKLNNLLTRGYTISGYSVYHESKHQHGFVTTAGMVGWWKPEGVEYPHPQPPRQPLTCNSCKGLGRVYRGCNEWAACVNCNTTGIGGEK